MRRLLLLIILCMPLSLAMAQERVFTVLTYNVENLYDTLHDEGKNDHEFLPNGERQWTQGRYHRKLVQIAKVIAAAGYPAPTDLIGLCEVENDSVLQALTQRTRLRRLGYAYIATNSRDSRGIDVALVYQPMRFQPLESRSLQVPPPSDKHRFTRDVLYVKGRVPTGDTLHTFLCHWPSRSGGQKETEAYRCSAAKVVRERCDSLLRQNPRSNILVMGDLNDEPRNRSIAEVLQAKESGRLATDGIAQLYILSKNLKQEGGIEGTYYYRGEWNQIDHFIVSGQLLDNTANFYTMPQHCEIFAPDFLTVTNPKDGTRMPKRTYQGTFYRGGTADHFPMRLQFLFK